jgi:hypothetical protein
MKTKSSKPEYNVVEQYLMFDVTSKKDILIKNGDRIISRDRIMPSEIKSLHRQAREYFKSKKK